MNGLRPKRTLHQNRKYHFLSDVSLPCFSTQLNNQGGNVKDSRKDQK